MKEIDDKTLYKFYKEISYLLDLCIVNNKQRQALDHKILLLMNQLFRFKLPEENIDNIRRLKMDEYDKRNKERWTRTAIRRAVYNEARGGFIAEKNTHAGATDFVLLNYKTMEPKIFKTSEAALKATTDKNHGWYH